MPALTPDASSACPGIAGLKSQRSRRANLRRKRDSRVAGLPRSSTRLFRGSLPHREPRPWRKMVAGRFSTASCTKSELTLFVLFVSAFQSTMSLKAPAGELRCLFGSGSRIVQRWTMPRKSRGFFGLSTGSLPPNFKPRVYVPPAEPVGHRQARLSRGSDILSPTERALITKHLPFYLSLANGTRKPDTGAQRHFVAVCRGTARPTTPHELAFVKWRARGRNKL
jgi:hypothetical protein